MRGTGGPAKSFQMVEFAGSHAHVDTGLWPRAGWFVILGTGRAPCGMERLLALRCFIGMDAQETGIPEFHRMSKALRAVPRGGTGAGPWVASTGLLLDYTCWAS
jgi:hypothetical protein